MPFDYTPTIAEIRACTLDKSPHFFSRDTMRFFGQTMRSFHVRRSPSGRVFIYARSGTTMPSHYTFREFTGDDLVFPRDESGERAKCDSEYSIISYIENH